MRGIDLLKTYCSKDKIRLGLMRGIDLLKTYCSKDKIRLGLMREWTN